MNPISLQDFYPYYYTIRIFKTITHVFLLFCWANNAFDTCIIYKNKLLLSSRILFLSFLVPPTMKRQKELNLFSKKHTHAHCKLVYQSPLSDSAKVWALYTVPDSFSRLRIQSKWSLQEIIRSPKSIQRARSISVESSPRLAFSTPMQKTHRTRMQIPTKSTKIIATKSMLVPFMINRSYFPSKHKQKRWKRTQLVNPHPLL